MLKSADIVGLSLIALVIAVAVFGCGWAGGEIVSTRKLQQQAIEAGVAEWRVDPQTGAVRFEWKGQAK